MPQQDPTTRLGRFEQAVARYPGRPKLLCEGDSWFAFPYATRRNIVRHLYNMALERPLPLLNIAGNGDEIREMMSGTAIEGVGPLIVSGRRNDEKPGSDPHIQQLNDRKPKE